MTPPKQRSTEQDWWDAWDRAPALWPLDRLQPLVDAAIAAITTCASPALAWSGGKDSVALAWLYEQAQPQLAGPPRGVSVITHGLEYPAMLHWLRANLPPGVEIVATPQHVAWLAVHPDWLFPQTSQGSSRWFAAVQHKGQDHWQRTHGGTLVLGRRRDDGNRVPAGNRYTKPDVGPRILPIADWPRDAVLALIRHHDLALPPIYRWPRGWRVGTGPWAKRRPPAGLDRAAGIAACWAELDQIDPGIRALAARYDLPGA